NRGVVLSSAALAGLLAQQATASVPALVLSSTIKSAVLVAAGQSATAAISAKVTALTSQMLKAMLLNKLQTMMVVLLLMGAAVGGGLATYHLATAKQVDSRSDDLPRQRYADSGSRLD